MLEDAITDRFHKESMQGINTNLLAQIRQHSFPFRHICAIMDNCFKLFLILFNEKADYHFRFVRLYFRNNSSILMG